jgi:hypothetical protein
LSKSLNLGAAAALVIFGCPGALVVEGCLGTRWFRWAAAVLPFLYIAYELLVGLGLADAIQLDTEPKAEALFLRAQVVTLLSWLTYSVVPVFPILGFSGSNAIVASQAGHCISGILSLCGVGLLLYYIATADCSGEYMWIDTDSGELVEAFSEGPTCIRAVSSDDEFTKLTVEVGPEAPQLPETVQQAEPEAAKLPEVIGLPEVRLQPPESFFIGECCFTDLEDMFSFDMELIAGGPPPAAAVSPEATELVLVGVPEVLGQLGAEPGALLQLGVWQPPLVAGLGPSGCGDVVKAMVMELSEGCP